MIAFKAHLSGIINVAFSPDGRFLATVGGDHVRLWKVQGKPELVSEWSSGTRLRCPLAFSPDGKFLVRGGSAGTSVWDLERGGFQVHGEDDICMALVFSPADQVCTLATLRGTISRRQCPTWEWLTGDWEGVRLAAGRDTYETEAWAFNLDGSLLARSFAIKGTTRYNSLILTWDTTTATLRHTLHSDFAYAQTDQVRFSPHGQLLAAVYGPLLRVWDLASEKPLAARMAGTKHVRGLTFTPDGKRLGTVSHDKFVRLWAAPDWTEAGSFEWQIGKLTTIDASRDGCRMAAGSSSGQVVLWDVD
jgi:WD40 repeat protein